MKSSNNEWISISDMMSGLMLVFMFIAISFMIQVQSDKEKMKEIAITYNKDKKELYKDLYKEFSKDLEKWEAEITQDNTIVFNSPEVLFKTGKSMISDEFKIILDEFFPRYIKVLSSIKYKIEIDEIRIEGHTSNGWSNKSKIEDIYLNNMQLSQDRANNVLSFCYIINKPIIIKHRKWLETHFRANGMAFAKLKYKDKEEKIQDKIKSRRVEFKVQLKTEDKIYKILEASS
ncbi:MAG: OmpA family protein [Campylobacterota bacterium]|nr:OmpA family protein [Campylobacterota bacterium]